MKSQAAQKDNAENQKTALRVKIHGMSHGFLDYLRPFYLGDDSGLQKFRYVLWVDIMGSQGKMMRNVRTASIPLMKLHVAALNAKKKTLGGVDLFPVIDGIYVVSERFDSMGFFISDVFRSMAAEFLVLKQWERSVIRGAIAFGPVILGAECKGGAPILKESDYANSILLGMPLVQAFTAEKAAPPFGVIVHESVRAFGEMRTHPVTVPLWRWWGRNLENTRIASALLPSLRDYFAWCRKNPVTSGYAPDRIDAHQALAEEYLPELEDASGSLSKRSQFRRPKSRETPRRKRDVVPGPEKQIAKLRRILNLSGEQVEQIKPILEEREQQVSEVSKDKSLDPEVRHLKVKDIVDGNRARIQSFLSEAQRNILVEREYSHRTSYRQV